MAIEKLTATALKITKPGRYGDGGGLWLQVSKWATKSWIFQFTSPATGKTRQFGLGPFGERDVSLADARDLAAEARRKVRLGIDPIEERRAERDTRRIEKAMGRVVGRTK